MKFDLLFLYANYMLSHASLMLFGLMKINSYYDTFLKKYLELAKARDWKQPLLGMYEFFFVFG